MTYFADLSDYVYDRSTLSERRPKNVGWLDVGADFRTMKPDSNVLDKLWAFCGISVLQSRGLHECHLCAPRESNVAERNGQRLLLGSAEIRVFSKGGQSYAAPNLIYHYVSVHNYAPPDDFAEAVRTGPDPSSGEYLARLAEAGLSWSETLVPKKDPVRVRFVRTENGVIVIKE